MYNLEIKSTLELKELKMALEDTMVNNQEYINKCKKLNTSSLVLDRKQERLLDLSNRLNQIDLG